MYFRLTRLSAVLSLPLLGLISACSVFDKPEPDPLPGERISVIQLQKGLVATPGLTAAPLTLPALISNTIWPVEGGNTAHAMNHVAGPQTLSQAWSVDVGDGSSANARITSAPIIADGRVYVKDARSGITAVDAASGSRIWSIDLTPKGESSSAGFGGGLAFSKDRLFAVTAFGFAVALNPATGEEIWRKEIGIPFRAPPLVAGGRLIATTIDNQAVAFDINDGGVLWSYQGISESAGLLKSGSPAARSDLVIIPFSSGEIIALRLVNGSFLWGDNLGRTGVTAPIGTIGAIAGSPVISRGVVYALSHSGRMTASSAQNGQRVWDRDLSGTQTPWLAGDHLFVVTGKGEVAALQTKDGGIRWITSLDHFTDPEDRQGLIQWNGPLLISGRLLFTSTHGQMVSMDPSTGEVIGSQEISKSSVPPIVANGTVYVLADSGELVAFR